MNQEQLAILFEENWNDIPFYARATLTFLMEKCEEHEEKIAKQEAELAALNALYRETLEENKRLNKMYVQ